MEKAKERNQAPMALPVIFLGASLVTMDRPMGDRNSSPVVWSRYIKPTIIRGTMASGPARALPISSTR